MPDKKRHHVFTEHTAQDLKYIFVYDVVCCNPVKQGDLIDLDGSTYTVEDMQIKPILTGCRVTLELRLATRH